MGGVSVHRPPTDEEMLRKYPRRSRTSDWFIGVEEISLGVYRVSARSRWGHEYRHTGIAGTDEEVEQLVEIVEGYIADN